MRSFAAQSSLSGGWSRHPALREVAEAVERRLHRRAPVGVSSEAAAIAGPFAGLPEPGAVHEWFASSERTAPIPGLRWLPPLGVLIDVAARVIDALPADEPRAVLWIGARCHPHPVAIAQRSRRLLERSVFVDAQGMEERVWAIDGALRCRDVGVVVGDAEGMDISASRRLQLASEAGWSLGLLARPPWEERELSVARTRWRVSPDPSENEREPGWIVELLRCKGLQPTLEGARRWTVRADHATGNVRVAPDVPDRSATPVAQRARRAV